MADFQVVGLNDQALSSWRFRRFHDETLGTINKSSSTERKEQGRLAYTGRGRKVCREKAGAIRGPDLCLDDISMPADNLVSLRNVLAALGIFVPVPAFLRAWILSVSSQGRKETPVGRNYPGWLVFCSIHLAVFLIACVVSSWFP
jgi:hypothetical protein